jgi:hypothetical protein
MHAISALIHQDCNRSIRAGIRNVLRHFSHDKRISNDEAILEAWRRYPYERSSRDQTRQIAPTLFCPGRGGSQVLIRVSEIQ